MPIVNKSSADGKEIISPSGESVMIALLTRRDTRLAEQSRTKKDMAMAKESDISFAGITITAEDRQRVQGPKDKYDLEMLLEASIVQWAMRCDCHSNAPIDTDHIERLDNKTFDWLVDEVIALNFITPSEGEA